MMPPSRDHRVRFNPDTEIPVTNYHNLRTRYYMTPLTMFTCKHPRFALWVAETCHSAPKTRGSRRRVVYACLDGHLEEEWRPLPLGCPWWHPAWARTHNWQERALSTEVASAWLRFSSRVLSPVSYLTRVLVFWSKKNWLKKQCTITVVQLWFTCHHPSNLSNLIQVNLGNSSIAYVFMAYNY